MIRWMAAPLLCVALMFVSSPAKASDVNFSVGVGGGYYPYYDSYTYYPYNSGYTNYYPYTYDTYGYYTPRYSYSTGANWYGSWGNDSWRDNNYWRGSYWDGGRRGSWDGRGTYNGSRGGFTGRVRMR